MDTPLAAAPALPPARPVRPRRLGGWPAEAAVGSAGLLLAGISLAVILYSTGGALAAPTDAAFIALRYAAQTAAGQPFVYNAGDEYSTGSASPLYVLILALIARLGPGGPGLLLAAHLLNIALFAVGAVLSYRLGCRARTPLVGGIAALFFLLSAPLLQGYAGATEAGLVCTLVLFSLYVVGSIQYAVGRDAGSGIRDQESGSATRNTQHITRSPFTTHNSQLTTLTARWLLPAALCALAWARPEGWGLGVIALGVAGLGMGGRRAGAGRRLGEVALAVAVGAAPWLGNWLLTGQALPNAWRVESLFEAAPQFHWLSFLRAWIGGFAAALTGGYGGPLVGGGLLPVGWLCVLVGGLPAAGREIARGRPGLLTLAAAWLLGGTLLGALLRPSPGGDAFLPYYGIFGLLAAVGLYDVAGALGRRAGWRRRAGTERGTALGLLGVGGVLLGAGVLPAWAAIGEATLDIYYQPVALGRWIAANLPPGARLAVTQPGALAYYSGHPVLDLRGRTTNATTHLPAAGEGAIYEWLRHLPSADRPAYFVLGRETLPTLAGLPGFLTPVYTAALPRRTVAESLAVSVFLPDWDALADRDAPLAAPSVGQAIDQLDVGWASDEAVHGYQAQGAQWNDPAPADLARADAPSGAFVDGGRRLTGYEEFTITADPGRALHIVARYLAAGPQQVRVAVDGRDAGLWARPAAPSWAESSFVVPAALVTRTHPRLRITLVPDAAFTPLRSFAYWIYP